jgi:prepilin-type N-terminal cleavage/methylation domain-containing protein
VSRLRDRQGGFTLIELLMGIALSSIFALALFSFFYAGVDSARTSESQARAQADGRTAIDRFVRESRQAVSPNGGLTPPIIALGPTSVEMYVDPSRDATSKIPRPYKVRYSIVADQLIRDSAAPVGAVAPYSYGSYVRPEVLIEKLANGATAAFSGAAGDGTALPATPNAVQLRDMAQMTIRLIVAQKTGNAASTLELTTDVSLRNAITI